MIRSLKSPNLIFILLALCLYVGWSKPTYAQHIVAKQVPFYYELASNEIFDIYQDREGYLWIGTTNGLTRYDGYRLQSFISNHANPHLLTNNSIQTITDNNHYVWIGTRSGLNLYNKQTCQIKPYPDPKLSSEPIRYLTTDHDGNVWIAAGSKVYKSSPDASTLKEYQLFAPNQPQFPLNEIYTDRSNTFWALTAGGGIFRYDSATDSFNSYPRLGKDNAPYTLFQDKEGRYWIGTWGEGLWRFFPNEPDCFKPCPVTNSRTGQTEPIFYSITQDDTFGYLWLLSYNELYALQPQANKAPLPVNISNKIDTHMMFTKITKDREGNLWLGSYDMAYTIFFDHSHIDNYTLPQFKQDMGWDVNIMSLCLDNHQTMWISQDRYGLCLYDLKDGQLVSSSMPGLSELGEVSYLTPSACNGSVWVCPRYGAKVLRMSQENMSVSKHEEIKLAEKTARPGSITHLEEDKEGFLWICTTSNLFIKKPFSKELMLTEKPFPTITAITHDETGSIWGVSDHQIIYHLTATANHYHASLTDTIPTLCKEEQIRHLCTDSNGRIWAVTSLGRILKSDSNKENFAPVDIGQATDNSSILGIAAKKNRVWLVTNKKALQYNIDNDSLSTYSINDDNIEVNVFRYRALHIDDEGGLYVGGHKGFVHIGPTSNGSVVSGHAFRPMVNDVRCNSQSLFFTRQPTQENDRSGNTTDLIELSPATRNIEICLSTMRYAFNSPITIGYRLEGIDDEWTYTDKQRPYAFYNSLPKGTYKLHLKAEYIPGKWTDEYVALTLIQLPAFYETWWACLTYVFAILSIGLYIMRRYHRHMKQKNIEMMADSREMLKIRDYLDSKTSRPTNSEYEQLDQLLLNRIDEIINEHVSNSEFGLDLLAQEMCMSKSTLNRKIKSATGITPLEYIRKLKMKHACELLANARLSIAEVAYEIGFNNPKYFTKCFKEIYGMTPSDYQQSLHNGHTPTQ